MGFAGKMACIGCSKPLRAHRDRWCLSYDVLVPKGHGRKIIITGREKQSLPHWSFKKSESLWYLSQETLAIWGLDKDQTMETRQVIDLRKERKECYLDNKEWWFKVKSVLFCGKSTCMYICWSMGLHKYWCNEYIAYHLQFSVICFIKYLCTLFCVLWLHKIGTQVDELFTSKSTIAELWGSRK